MKAVDKLKTLGCYDFGNKPYSLKVHHLLELCGINFFAYPQEMEKLTVDNIALIYYVIDNKAEAAKSIYTYIQQVATIEQAKDKLSNEDYLGYQLSACNRIVDLRQVALDYVDANYNMTADKLKGNLLDYWHKEVQPWGNIEETKSEADKLFSELDKKKE